MDEELSAAETFLLIQEKLKQYVEEKGLIWLVVSTHLKNISQIGSFPQIGMKINNLKNHHVVINEELMYQNIYLHLQRGTKWFRIQGVNVPSFRV